jgi:hypothetical protein
MRATSERVLGLSQEPTNVSRAIRPRKGLERQYLLSAAPFVPRKLPAFLTDRQSPNRARSIMMTTLTVTKRGQVTFRKDVLRHLGIQPGGKIRRDLLPDGRAELRAEHAWVLARHYAIPRADIAAAIRRLVETCSVVVNRPAVAAASACSRPVATSPTALLPVAGGLGARCSSFSTEKQSPLSPSTATKPTCCPERGSERLVWSLRGEHGWRYHTRAGERVSMVGEKPPHPVHDGAHASGAAKIAVDDHPVFRSNLRQ